MVEVSHYRKMVKSIAFLMSERLSANIEIDDLVQVGMIGAHEAISRYDENHSSSTALDSWVYERARGAMLDYLRQGDPLGRNVRRKLKEAEKAAQKLENKFGHPPRESDVAEEIGMRLDDFQKLRLMSEGTTAASMDDDVFPEQASLGLTPEEAYEKMNIIEQIDRLIKRLPERNQIALIGYYIEGRTIESIGVDLGVGDSRVLQLCNEAILRIRARLIR